MLVSTGGYVKRFLNHPLLVKIFTPDSGPERRWQLQLAAVFITGFSRRFRFHVWNRMNLSPSLIPYNPILSILRSYFTTNPIISQNFYSCISQIFSESTVPSGPWPRSELGLQRRRNSVLNRHGWGDGIVPYAAGLRLPAVDAMLTDNEFRSQLAWWTYTLICKQRA